jgi:mannosyltransferase OCH1-like enzyme
MVIPKIIHQTWKTSIVPDRWKKSQDEWKRLHPTWRYILWTDEENRKLIADKYSWFLPIYDSYRYNIQRVDAVRYFILYEYGGVYSDLDLYPAKPIDAFVAGSEEAYFVPSPSVAEIFTNAFMVSTKKAAFWLKVFDKLKENTVPYWANFSRHMFIMYSTGPKMIDGIIKNYTNTLGLLPKVKFSNFDNDEKHSNAFFDENAVLLPLAGSSWCGFDSHVFNFINQYKSELAVLAIVLIILIIVFALIYVIRYRKLFKTCEVKLATKCPLRA